MQRDGVIRIVFDRHQHTEKASDPERRLALCDMVNVHSESHATHYRSGCEYQHEFAAGQHVGAWTMGIGDKVNGVATCGDRSRVLALGPAHQYFAPGSGWPLVTAHFRCNAVQCNRDAY
jgi:hypothetical protein